MQHDELMIRDLSLALDDDYRLAFEAMRDIYESTDMMCQPFAQKYSDFAAFKTSVKEGHSAPGAVFIIGKIEERAVGYITINPVPAARLAHTAYLNMGVRDDQRGKQLGRKLLNAAMQRVVSDRIIEIVYLNVRADNEPAVRLYESANFDTIAVLTRDTKIGDKYYDGLLMRRFVV